MAKPTSNSDWMEGDTPDTADLIEPTVGKKATGFTSGEKPAYQFVNWIKWNVNKWIKFIYEDLVSQEHNDDGTHSTINATRIITTGATSASTTIGTRVTGDATSRWRTFANGTHLFSDGSVTHDVGFNRFGVKSFRIDDTVVGNLIEVQLLTDLLTLNGDITNITGKTYFQPDVAGGAANDGLFVGANGGFMWFDGATNGVTDVTLDSTLDWRDRWVSVTAYRINQATPANYQPGGANDNVIHGDIDQNAAATAAIITDRADTIFYTEQGGSGAVSPWGILGDDSADDIMIRANSTNGNLELRKISDTGIEIAFGLLVIFSSDQGHY